MQESTLAAAYIPSNQTLRIVGDLHGQYEDLCKLFEEHGESGPGNAYLFNGNGSSGVVFMPFAEGASMKGGCLC
jgi:hypothetical protein